MNSTVLYSQGFSSYENKMSYNHATLFLTTKPITFKKSSTKAHHGSSTTTNRSRVVQCQSSPQVSNLVESREQSQLRASAPIPIPTRSPPLEGVVRSSANFVPLSPITFLERAAQVFENRTSVIYGSIRFTWKETYIRCLKLAQALNRLGISRGDVVAILAPNVPAMLELHFAVPMTGAIICALNTRLDSRMLSTHLTHSEAKILFVDHQLLQTAQDAINLLNATGTTTKPPPLLVTISELDSLHSPSTPHAHKYDYENLIHETGEKTNFSIVKPNDECDPISLNYTSGTTSRPKGVVFSHRGAYLNSIACVFTHGMVHGSTYLWSVPMFHCNGWCFSWGTAIVGATNVCLRRCDPNVIFDNIVTHKVTHMCGAPTVLNMIANSLSADQKTLPHRVDIMTGGAPPPPTILSKIEKLGFHVCHIYGLTETYGPATCCFRKPEWESLPVDQQLTLNARQGVKHFGMDDVDVKDPVTMDSVKGDGKTIGEIMFKGNTVMCGYLKDPKATEEAFSGGWFRSGDLGVKHEDGYIEVKDRLKDIIISGGENISTIEVETVIYGHPGVLEVAVVARPDDHWGQTPCAFVKLKEGVVVDGQEIIDYCRDHMAHYMAPRTVVFEDLPRNSTGKVQKFMLRKKAEAMGSLY